jgi:hypothetical protein
MMLTPKYHSCQQAPSCYNENLNHPTLEEIIQAMEQQIDFWKSANKDEIAKNLNVSIERVESVSDTELNEIRLDNMWLYETIIKSLKEGKTEFEVISSKDNSFKISFKEKEEGSLALIMSFLYKNNILRVDKKG